MNIQALIKIARLIPDTTKETAMPPQNPVVPGIGVPPPAGRITPPEVKTPALPVPPQHKSELPEAGVDKKFDWLKDWMAKNRAEKSLIKKRDPYNIPAQLLRRNPVDRLKGLNRDLAN